MFFGRVPVADAEGGLLPHRITAGEITLPKGHVLVAAECEALKQAGLQTITIARLEAGDLGEDEAAHRLAKATGDASIAVAEAFTGRANLFAGADGLLVVEPQRIDALNTLDEAMTIATLPPFARVRAGEMVGTVKIIPFALPERSVIAGEAVLGGEALRIAPFLGLRAGVISLIAPGLKPSVIEKTLRITDERLGSVAARRVFEHRIEQDELALSALLSSLDPQSFDTLIIFGAAAITDRRDVIPASIVRAGGTITHLGMPVDPGNLLLLAEFHGKPVIGAPGCARSPRENGFDWVLARICAGLKVSCADIQRMGVGGLLHEIETRPQRRSGESV